MPTKAPLTAEKTLLTAAEEILHFVSCLVEIPRKISQSMPLYENAAKLINANIIKR